MPDTPSDRPVRRTLRRLLRVPVLPTLLTCGNLMCGVTAVLCAAAATGQDYGQLHLGALLVFAAMVFDMFDGKVARMTHCEGPFGAELDSLADVISFGVAPAMLVHRLVLGKNPSDIWGEGETFIWILSVVYVALTAIRLARYNVEHSDMPTNRFRGLPSPGAAAMLCGWVLLVVHYAPESAYHGSLMDHLGMANATFLACTRYFLILAMLLAATLMVSPFPFIHVGNTLLSGQIGFRRLTLLLLLGGLLFARPYYAVAGAVTVYVGLGTVMGLARLGLAWHRWRKVLAEEDDDDDDDELPPAQPGT